MSNFSTKSNCNLLSVKLLDYSVCFIALVRSESIVEFYRLNCFIENSFRHQKYCISSVIEGCSLFLSLISLFVLGPDKFLQLWHDHDYQCAVRKRSSILSQGEASSRSSFKFIRWSRGKRTYQFLVIPARTTQLV